MAYTRYHNPWHDADSATGGGDVTTPIAAAALDHIEAGIEAAAATADAAAATAGSAYTLAAAAIPAPGSPASNTGLFWNGSAWVADKVTDARIDAAAAISISKLAGYPSDSTKFLRGDASWAVPVSSGNLIKLYDSGVLSATAASATLSSIASTYAAIKIVVDCRGDTAANFTDLRIRFNGDTGANYWFIGQENFGAWGAGGVSLATAQVWGWCGRFAAASAATGHGGSFEIIIPNYADTHFYKKAFSNFANDNASGAGNDLGGGFAITSWHSAAAITSITLLPSAGNFAAGSRLVIYGLGVS